MKSAPAFLSLPSEKHYPFQGLIFQWQRKHQSLYPECVVVAVKSLSCVRLLCDPMDCSPPGSFVHGISQARIQFPKLPFPSLGHIPRPGIKPMSPALAEGFFTSQPPGKPTMHLTLVLNLNKVSGDSFLLWCYYHIAKIVNYIRRETNRKPPGKGMRFSNFIERYIP